MPAAQPVVHTPATRVGCPRCVQTRSTPSLQETPSSAQIVTAEPSAAVAGRRMATAGAHSCSRATSAVAATSSPSFTHAVAHAPADCHAQAHAPGSSFGAVQGWGTWPATEVSTLPPTQRARPSEQSRPPRSTGAPRAPDPRGPEPPRPGVSDRGRDEPPLPTPCSSSQVERQPFSQPASANASATSIAHEHGAEVGERAGTLGG